MKRGAIFLYLTIALLTISLASAQPSCFISPDCDAASNMIINGDFETGDTTNWDRLNKPTCADNFESIAGTGNPDHGGRVYLGNGCGGGEVYYVGGLTLEPNTDYKLTFDARTSNNFDMDVSVRSSFTKANYGMNSVFFDPTSTWQTYEHIFTTSGFGSTVNDGEILIEVTQNAPWGNLYLDNFKFQKSTDSFTEYGYISTQGHYIDTLSATADYPYKLCCPDVWASGTGNTSFKFSEYIPPLINGSNHVSTIYSSITTFTGEVQLGTDYCVNRASCEADESCIFKMSNPDNAHIADCDTVDHPIPNSFGGELCCLVTEVCWDGLDNDLDGFTDCADSDCFGGSFGAHPDRPQVCTGSPQNTTFCAPAYNYTSGQTIFNDECRGEVPPGDTYYYCAYGLSDDADIDPVGVCCPYETYPHLVAGQWVCDDEISPGVFLDECGLQGSLDCQRDFDGDIPDFFPPNTPNWLSKVYTNDPDDWCNTQVSNIYIDPVVAPYAGSTGCCLIQKFGEYDYYVDELNIKIWG